MNKLTYVLALSILSIFSCQKQQSADSELEDSAITSSKTNSEISIKEGGHWEEREYIDGTFKNVSQLNVPKEHTDHSWYIRYEGPGWESSKVGYRLYLDWRNAIDIFGKTTDELILSNVGQDGFDSYHEKQDWGMDILKVGKGLGLGSLGRNLNGEVLHFNNVDSTSASVINTSESSSVLIKYNGWQTAEDKIDLNSTLTIYPDQRYTKHTVKSSQAISGICTGIVDHGVDYMFNTSEEWGYIATYGVQTLVPDQLGMAIFYQIKTIEDLEKGAHDYLINFKPTTEEVSFYFLAAWEQEPSGIKTKKEFELYLEGLLEQLSENNTL